MQVNLVAPRPYNDDTTLSTSTLNNYSTKQRSLALTFTGGAEYTASKGQPGRIKHYGNSSHKRKEECPVFTLHNDTTVTVRCGSANVSYILRSFLFFNHLTMFWLLFSFKVGGKKSRKEVNRRICLI